MRAEGQNIRFPQTPKNLSYRYRLQSGRLDTAGSRRGHVAVICATGYRFFGFFSRPVG